jgi:Alginate export
MQKINTPLQNNPALKNRDFVKARFSKSLLFGIAFTFISYNETKAQLTATGQLRTRTEMRQGQGTLTQEGDVPVLFTSQRTRLNVGFNGYRFKFFTALQDVRVWGQDGSTINRTTNDANDGFLIHEAWAEVILNDTITTIQNFSLKVGRQQISYDDQRLLGGLDWLQQGRRHDAAVLKFSNKGWMADLGVAYNQNKEANNYNLNTNLYNGTPTGYTAGTNGIGTLYKSFQYLYLGRKFAFGDASLLYFGDNFNQYTVTGTGATAVKNYERGVWTRNTIGAYCSTNITRKLNLTGSLYHQGGHDKDGRSINANAASLAGTYQIGRKLFVGPGVDYLSGDDGIDVFTPTSDTKRFDPLYGTPHKFWGYMDYFYVASPFGRNGLLNYFFKAKYNAKDNLTFTLDIHGFKSAGKLKGDLNPYLGTEADLTVKYSLTKIVGLELGYSFMKGTATLASAQVKNVTNPVRDAHWAYLMLNITPNFMAKK